ncbi:MAG: hypothetical protein ACI81I_000690, partial [Arcobacteraceae bacterium]
SWFFISAFCRPLVTFKGYNTHTFKTKVKNMHKIITLLFVKLVFVSVLHASCGSQITDYGNMIASQVSNNKALDFGFGDFYIEKEIDASLINTPFQKITENLFPLIIDIKSLNIKGEVSHEIFKSTFYNTSIKDEIKIKEAIGLHVVNTSYSLKENPVIRVSGSPYSGVDFTFSNYHSEFDIDTLLSNIKENTAFTKKTSMKYSLLFPAHGFQIDFSVALEIETEDLLAIKELGLDGNILFGFDEFSVHIPSDVFLKANTLINLKQSLLAILDEFKNNIRIENEYFLTDFITDGSELDLKISHPIELSIHALAPSKGGSAQGLSKYLNTLSSHDKYELFYKFKPSKKLNEADVQFSWEIGIKQPVTKTSILKHTLVKQTSVDEKPQTIEVTQLVNILTQLIRSYYLDFDKLEESLKKSLEMVNDCANEIKQKAEEVANEIINEASNNASKIAAAANTLAKLDAKDIKNEAQNEANKITSKANQVAYDIKKDAQKEANKITSKAKQSEYDIKKEAKSWANKLKKKAKSWSNKLKKKAKKWSNKLKKKAKKWAKKLKFW